MLLIIKQCTNKRRLVFGLHDHHPGLLGELAATEQASSGYVCNKNGQTLRWVAFYLRSRGVICIPASTASNV
jgi:hypothetical protein